MKTKVAILLSLLLVFSLTIGTASFAEEPVIEIDYWCNTAEPANDEEYAVNFPQQYVDMFNAAHDNIHVNLIYCATNWDEIQKRLTLAASSDSLPDVFDFTPDAAWGLPEAGVIADLTDYLEQDEEWKSRFAVGAFDLMNMIGSGRIYAIPYSCEVQGWYFNADLLAKYGLEVTDKMTWDDFVNICNVLKENNEVVLAHGAKDAWSLWGCWNLYPQYGFLDQMAALKSGELKFSEAPSFKQTYERIAELHDIISTPENEMTMGYAEAMEYFLAGKAAFLSTGSFALPDLQKADFNVGYTYGPIVPDPVASETYGCKAFGWLQFVGRCATETPEKMAAVIEFIKYRSDPSLIDLMVKCGITPAVKKEMINFDLFGDASATQATLAATYDDRAACAPITFYFDNSLNSSLFNAHTNLLTAELSVDEVLTEFDDWFDFFSMQ